MNTALIILGVFSLYVLNKIRYALEELVEIRLVEFNRSRKS